MTEERDIKIGSIVMLDPFVSVGVRTKIFQDNSKGSAYDDIILSESMVFEGEGKVVSLNTYWLDIYELDNGYYYHRNWLLMKGVDYE